MPDTLNDWFTKTFIGFVRVSWDTALGLKCRPSFKFYLMKRRFSVASQIAHIKHILPLLIIT